MKVGAQDSPCILRSKLRGTKLYIDVRLSISKTTTHSIP